MKLRSGFVSNSSSSSFIIAGISLEEKELARRLGISVEDAEENEIEAGKLKIILLLIWLLDLDVDRLKLVLHVEVKDFLNIIN